MSGITYLHSLPSLCHTEVYNFPFMQFVNFTGIMSKNVSPSEKEAAFALAALMEIPFQYKATIELGILGYDPYTLE